jgi:PAS domain S-box-containing protein
MMNVLPVNELDLYLQILNKLANPIFVKDEHHVFIMINDAFCDLFKLNPKDIVGKSDEQLFPEQEWQVFHKKDLKILHTGESDQNEEDVTIPGGRTLRVVTTKSLITSDSGERYVLGIITDITEKTALAEIIRESRKKYKTIFNMGADPSGLITYPGWILHEVNDASAEIAGLSRKNLTGKTADLIFSWADPRERQSFFTTLERRKRVQNMEIGLRNYRGEVLSFLASAKIFRLHDKPFLLYAMRDITDLKKTEATLKDSRMFYREMVEYSPIPMFIHRLGVIVFANDAAIAFSGVMRDRVMGHRIQDVIRIPIAADMDTNLEFLFSQPSHTWETKDVLLETNEGVPRHFILRNVRLKYGGDWATMTKILDITEQGNLEEYILNKIIQAEENERKRFAADLHDDIGPLLSTIKIHLQLLERSHDTRKNEEMIRILELRINEVIQKIYQISHSISPHTIVDFGLEGAVGEFCRQINDMEIYKVHFEHNIDRMRFPDDVELHFYRIILELLNNSMKYSLAREMSVSLKYQNGNLRLRYFDHGKGYDFQEVLNQTTTLGIKNIIHRASLMNAEIRFRRVRGRTIVLVSAPVMPV